VKKTTSCAFTLIEVLVAMAIIGLLVSMAPRLMLRQPQKDVSFVLQQLNRLVELARQEAIVSNKLHRIVFHSKLVSLQKEEMDTENPLAINFKPVESAQLKPEYKLPDFVEMRSFFLNGKNILDEYSGDAFVYITPEGMSQPVFVQLLEIREGREEQLTFKMQPFLGRFEREDGWVKE